MSGKSRKLKRSRLTEFEETSQATVEQTMAPSVSATLSDLPPEYKPIFSRLEKAFTSSDWSDLRITCGDFGWDVHRVIVCPGSEFFNSCCKNFKEAKDGVIDLPDDDRHAVDALLRYLYTANYDDEAAIGDAAPILFNVHVHTIADKYNIPELCKLAEAKFADRASREWNTEGFAEAVKEMYATSPDSKKILQDSAVAQAVEHAKELFTDDQSLFQTIAQTVAPFAYGISAKLMAVHVEQIEVRRCPSCSWKHKQQDLTRAHNLYGSPFPLCPSCGHTHPWDQWIQEAE
ncbi:putative BTB/POZ domain-containing protein [Septoria linicola]|nr:putative BTB/POZ domain-containing protein [Septoria linicola]